jgi:hypothetical protein
VVVVYLYYFIFVTNWLVVGGCWWDVGRKVGMDDARFGNKKERNQRAKLDRFMIYGDTSLL